VSGPEHPCSRIQETTRRRRWRRATDLPDPTLVLRRASVSRKSGRWQDDDYDVFDVGLQRGDAAAILRGISAWLERTQP
jgi:hypothetical protein